MDDKSQKAIVGTLIAAGVLGLFRLAFAVNSLTVEVQYLRKEVDKLSERTTYFHGEDKR